MKPILSEEQLHEGVLRLASEINAFYEGRTITVIGVLTGSVVFLADLIRRLDSPTRVGVVQARSYRGESTRRGPLVINDDLLPDIEAHDVLLVDDIFDTGHTLRELIERFERLGPTSLRSCVLLRKQGRAETSLAPNYIGFEIPNQFVVGYGLDYNDAYRNLPYLAALEPDDIARGGS